MPGMTSPASRTRIGGWISSTPFLPGDLYVYWASLTILSNHALGEDSKELVVVGYQQYHLAMKLPVCDTGLNVNLHVFTKSFHGSFTGKCIDSWLNCLLFRSGEMLWSNGCH